MNATTTFAPGEGTTAVHAISLYAEEVVRASLVVRAVPGDEESADDRCEAALEAGCPVLLASPSENASSGALRRIAVPLDGSLAAEAALPVAAALAQATDAHVTLVRVAPWRTNRPAVLPYLPELRAVEARIEAGAREYLEAACRLLPRGVAHDAVVLRGDVIRELSDYVEAFGIDLVVMTHARHCPEERSTRGSVAAQLAAATGAVLLVPFGGAEGAATAGGIESLSGPLAQPGTGVPGREADDRAEYRAAEPSEVIVCPTN